MFRNVNSIQMCNRRVGETRQKLGKLGNRQQLEKSESHPRRHLWLAYYLGVIERHAFGDARGFTNSGMLLIRGPIGGPFVVRAELF